MSIESQATKDRVRIAAVADLHFSRTPNPIIAALTAAGGPATEADLLVLCGDLTDHGLTEEAQGLAKELATLRMPIVAVLGNHDHHSDQHAEIKKVLADTPIHLLDGDAVHLLGVGFAGVKGFGTGFGRRILEPWGEASVRSFVREAVEEALKLETALARIPRGPRVALTHYAPILDTVEGEPLEIQPFLGSSRLEEPLNRFQVTVAFHGHAHHGRPEGRTSAGVPVYNVSAPLLRSLAPGAPPFRIVELDTASTA